jgi:Integrase core domain
LFFAFILDVYSRMIVGWQLAGHMRTDLVLDALRMALGTREHGADFALVAHTDAGSQYTSFDYIQQLDDAKVLASVGSVGDCFDNAMAESLVDSYKTELIRDRVWRTRTQLELATIEWVGWYNHDRLHEALGDIPPIEFEQLHADTDALNVPISVDGSVAGLASRAAERLTTRRLATAAVDLVAHGPIPPENASATANGIGSGRSNGGQGTNGRVWPLRPAVRETYWLAETSKPTRSTTEEPT